MIEEEVYSHISGLKKVKSIAPIPEEGISLGDLARRTWGEASYHDILKALCGELKVLLDTQDIAGLVKGIFSIENNLSLILESCEGENAPSLDRFFRNLSPVFLRALYQNSNNPIDTELIIHDWVEALRIALEEEYYFWQEQLLEV